MFPFEFTFSVLRLTWNIIFQKGLILGVYNSENSKIVELSTAAQNYNQKVDGKLLEQIRL